METKKDSDYIHSFFHINRQTLKATELISTELISRLLPHYAQGRTTQN